MVQRQQELEQVALRGSPEKSYCSAGCERRET